jgi:hypothetical protein
MDDREKRVVIGGIDIPFIDLVILLVKLALASIPAMIIIYTVFALLSTLFGGFFDFFILRG